MNALHVILLITSNKILMENPLGNAYAKMAIIMIIIIIYVNNVRNFGN